MKTVYTFAVEAFDPHRDAEKAEKFRDAYSRTTGAEGIHPRPEGLILAYSALPLAEHAWHRFTDTGLKTASWIMDASLSDDRQTMTIGNPVKCMRLGGVKP